MPTSKKSQGADRNNNYILKLGKKLLGMGHKNIVTFCGPFTDCTKFLVIILVNISMFKYLFDILLIRRGMKVRSPGSSKIPILKSICSGLIKNVAQKKRLHGSKHTYFATPFRIVYIHPESTLFHISPKWYFCFLQFPNMFLMLNII